MKGPHAPLPGPLSWPEDLVTTALLGTDRRTPPGLPPGREAPAALLDAAAVETVRRRAGLRPAPAAPRPEPAAPRPPPPAARRGGPRLAALLADRPGTGGGRRGAAPDLRELLPQWLALANDTGLRRPARAAPRAAGRGPGANGPASGGARRSRGRGRCGWPGSTPTGGSRCGRRRAAGDCPRPEESDRVRDLWRRGLFAERVALLSGAQRPRPRRRAVRCCPRPGRRSGPRTG